MGGNISEREKRIMIFFSLSNSRQREVYIFSFVSHCSLSYAVTPPHCLIYNKPRLQIGYDSYKKHYALQHFFS